MKSSFEHENLNVSKNAHFYLLRFFINTQCAQVISVVKLKEDCKLKKKKKHVKKEYLNFSGERKLQHLHSSK